MEPRIAQNIIKHLEKLSIGTFSRQLDIKKLKGYPRKPSPYRMRVGDYRVTYFIEDEEIRVTKIFHRGEGYDF